MISFYVFLHFTSMNISESNKFIHYDSLSWLFEQKKLKSKKQEGIKNYLSNTSRILSAILRFENGL